MEKPEGRGPWTNWLQTVQGVVGGNEARKSPEGRLCFYGLRNWVSSIAIYKSMDSKDKYQVLGKQNIFSTLTPVPHLFYEAGSTGIICNLCSKG